jgi:hypothetical protein
MATVMSEVALLAAKVTATAEATTATMAMTAILTPNLLPRARMDLLDWFFSFSTTYNLSF